MDFDKTPYEEFFRYLNFATVPLNDGETIQSIAESLVIDIASGESVPAMISDAAVYAPENVKVIYKIKGGTSKKEYRSILRIVTTNNQRFEGVEFFKVK